MMNKISRTFCGVTTALLFTLSLSACGDDSSSSPDYNETNSSAIEQTDLSSAGNDDILSSSDVPPTSSNSAPKSSDAKPASSSVSPTSSSDTPTSSEAVPESSSEFNAKNNCLPGGDCDGDGIPDWFEEKAGLNVKDGKDAALITLDKNNRYTNLEMYLHYLVKDIVAGQNAGGSYMKL